MAVISAKNITAGSVATQLNEAQDLLSQTLERLSSGKRINKFTDDPADVALSRSLSTDKKVLEQGIRNINDGISLISTAEESVISLHNIMTQMRELANLASNGAKSSSQREALDAEAQRLATEYNRQVSAAEYNDKKLLDGSFTELRIQAGRGEEGGFSDDLGGAVNTSFTVVAQQATGTFGAASSYSTATVNASTGNVEFADVNGDGNLDMLSSVNTDALDGYFSIRLGDGTGSFGAMTTYAQETSRSHSIRVGDINGDNYLDIVTFGQSDTFKGYATARLGNGDGTFGAATSFEMETHVSNSASTLDGELVDVNGDGNLDIISAGTVTTSPGVQQGYSTIRLGNGAGSFGAATSYTTETWRSIAVEIADVNKDGNLDLITAGHTAGDASSDGYATIRLGNGDGTFGAATSYASESNISYDLELADVNADGELDLITTGDTDSANGYTTVRIGNGDGTFGAATSYASETGGSANVEIADVNADGHVDVITAGISSGNDGYTTIRFGDSTGSFGAATSYASDTFRSSDVEVLDIDGDRIVDIVTAGRSDSSDGSVSILLGESTGNIQDFTLLTQYEAELAFSLFEGKLEQLELQLGEITAFESRANVALSATTSNVTHLSGAIPKIVDIDVAEEVATKVYAELLTNTATAMFAQANLQPNIVLELLQ